MVEDADPKIEAFIKEHRAELALLGIEVAGSMFGAPGAATALFALGPQVWAKALAKREARAVTALAVAAARLGGVDQVRELIFSDDAHLELAAQVVEASARTTHLGKVRGLGCVLANSAAAAKVDESLILTIALRDLEAPHLQVLAALRDHADAEHEVDRSKAYLATHLDTDQLRQRLPGHAVVLDAVLSVLYGHALVDNMTTGLSFSGGLGHLWGITSTGRLCLQYVIDASDG